MTKTMKVSIVVALVLLVGIVLAMKRDDTPAQQGPEDSAQPPVQAVGSAQEEASVPRLVELGSVSCIPCKMMEPILDELREDYAGKLQVDFIDVKKNPDVAQRHGIRVIPTQIMFAPSGEELYRHEGFFAKEDILAKWRELGFDFAQPDQEASAFQRLEPARPDARPADTVCAMCDGDVQPRTLVTVQTENGDVRFCSPHCYFIMYSCLTGDRDGLEQNARVTDYESGESVPVVQALYVYGLEPADGRPWIRAFATREAARGQREVAGGTVLSYSAVKQEELSHRCGFCDRACYPADAARVIAGGIQTWGCCSHCALGVAARTGLDLEVYQPDRLTGEMVTVKTVDGSVASLEPETAVAWFGMRRKADGTWGSAGCFHQGFFVNQKNLRRWVEANPYETGKQISIQRALADKIKMTPQQIAGACKVGECTP